MSDDIHEVYAVCYATHARKRSENYIFGDPHDEMTSISYYVWVIKGSHGAFVVDTGFDAAMATKRGRTIEKPVAEGLKAIDIAPDKVQLAGAQLAEADDGVGARHPRTVAAELAGCASCCRTCASIHV